VHSLHLRQALQHLGVGDYDRSAPFSLSVLSLSSDPGALAIGPQLAVFAATLGVPTALVIDPKGDAPATAVLRVACSTAPPAGSNRPVLLRVADSVEAGRQMGAALTVAVVVLDRQDPQVADMARTTMTTFAVTAGATTAEQLAKAAASATTDGREIAGIFVGNPDPTDRTTGHIRHQPARSGQRSIARRVNDATAELRQIRVNR
jgi:hypothetical protein